MIHIVDGFPKKDGYMEAFWELIMDVVAGIWGECMVWHKELKEKIKRRKK